jgi:AcrR family transcriptional regulator
MPMTVAGVQRREPVQARSRLTVTRILDAAAAIADEHGVDATTTRAIADRAGVSYPSLYRFFADRDAILDELLERHCAELDARCVAAEQTWNVISVAELLNNELDDFAAREGASNAFGLTGGDANAPGPRKRPLSSMSPSFVFEDGALRLVTGSPGGSRIINIVLQVIMNVIDHKMNAAEATEAPRIHHQWLPDELRVEKGL